MPVAHSILEDEALPKGKHTGETPSYKVGVMGAKQKHAWLFTARSAQAFPLEDWKHKPPNAAFATLQACTVVVATNGLMVAPLTLAATVERNKLEFRLTSANPTCVIGLTPLPLTLHKHLHNLSASPPHPNPGLLPDQNPRTSRLTTSSLSSSRSRVQDAAVAEQV
jgi:hypothetical protein